MNKFINILLLLLVFPAIGLAIIIGFDLPLDFLRMSGANIPYKFEIFCGFAGLVLAVGFRRSPRRWMGVRMVNQLGRFQWNAPMAAHRYRQSMLYLSLEAALHLSVAFGLFLLTAYAWILAGVLPRVGNVRRLGRADRARSLRPRRSGRSRRHHHRARRDLDRRGD